MKRSRSWLVRAAAIATVGVLVAGACGNDDDDASAGEGGGNGDLSGEVIVSGSSTVEPISARNAEKFNEANPEVAISVDGPGTGDGFEIFCAGESDVSDASRAIKDEEIETCESNDIEFVELLVARDAMSVITSPDNDGVECLSFLDLYALLGPESEGFGKWSAADDLAGELAGALGGELGESHAPYPDADLVVTAPGEESGTYDSFVELALEKIAEERGTEAQSRADYQASPNDNVIIDGISGSSSSLGWVGFSFVVANPDAVNALEVDGGDGCVAPSAGTVNDGTYPLARPLFVYVNKAKAEENTALAAYIDFYMTDEGFASVSEGCETASPPCYVDLTAEEVEATRSAWESMTTGARFGKA